MKQCSKCQEEKELSEFYENKRLKSGFMSACKQCDNAASRQYNKKNKDSIRQNKIEYREEKHQEICEKDRQRYQSKKQEIQENYYLNRDEILIKRRSRYHKKKDQYRESARRQYHIRKFKNPEGITLARRNFYERHKNEPEYKIARSIRWGVSRISRALKTKKNLHSLEYLGCSFSELKKYLESLWLDGMTWENYGLSGWHIDHKIPLDWFIKNSINPWEANHYSNLQPLWAFDNMSKGARF